MAGDAQVTLSRTTLYTLLSRAVQHAIANGGEFWLVASTIDIVRHNAGELVPNQCAALADLVRSHLANRAAPEDCRREWRKLLKDLAP